MGQNPNKGDYSIFLVDDDNFHRSLYKRILNTFGYQVIATAKNGMEAIEKYKNFSKYPNLVIMDYNMPGKTGIDAGNVIKKINKQAKILIMSSDTEIKEEVILNGMSFIDKASSIKNLLEELQKIEDST